jgi:ATP synthase F1 gamma subunit
VSKSLVTRFKSELRTTTDLMELVDVLKRVALSQFHTLDSTRQRLGWQKSEAPARDDDLLVDPSPLASGGPTSPADPDAKGPALSLSVVLEGFFRLIPPEQCHHPFLSRPAPPLGIVIVTSDEGFLGGLNSAVIQHALAAREGRPAELVVLGGRGRNYFTDIGQPFTQFPGIGEHIVSQRVDALRDHIAEQFLRRKVARVLVVYPRPLSFTQQEVHSVQLLPYERPPRGPGVGSSEPTETILEPAAYPIIEYLIKLWVSRQLHEVFWQSRLAELGARAMHLEASSLELAQRKKKQTLQYFRGLHEVTDTSIRETYAGVVARRREAAERRR